jgi:hypothetical protein
VQAFDEGIDGVVTLRVVVSGEFNVILFERGVFGVCPEDLEECNDILSLMAVEEVEATADQVVTILSGQP